MEKTPEEIDVTTAAAVAYEKATAPFYQALGAFLHQYSVLESCMLFLLWRVAGVSQEVGQSIFSGIRIRQAKDFINRILDATNRQEMKDRLKPYFDQIGLLTAMRDDILHYGAVYDFERNVLVVSNERVAHIPTNLRQFEVSPSLLDDMTHDVSRALHALIRDGKAPRPDEPEIFYGQKSSSWRYTPPPPTPHKPSQAVILRLKRHPNDAFQERFRSSLPEKEEP